MKKCVCLMSAALFSFLFIAFVSSIANPQPKMENMMTAQIEIKKPVIYSITNEGVPGTGPVGTVITITGETFGAEQGNKVAVIYFYNPSGHRTFYMDLKIISWSDTKIVAQLPSWNSPNFRITPDYETRVPLNGDILEYAKTYWMNGEVRIVRMPDTLLSNESPFRVDPNSGAPKIQYMPETVYRHEILKIYGSGFGEIEGEAGGVIYRKAGIIGLTDRIFGSEKRLDVDKWNETQVDVRIDDEIAPGDYLIYVKDEADQMSRPRQIKIDVLIEPAPTPANVMHKDVPPKMDAYTRPATGTVHSKDEEELEAKPTPMRAYPPSAD